MQAAVTDTNLVGLAIQSVGTIFVASLFRLLTPSVQRAYFQSWERAWGALALSLSSLLIAFCVPSMYIVFCAAYLFFGYAFTLFMVNGCMVTDGGSGLACRRKTLGGVAALVTVSLLFLSSFDLIFAIHAVFLASGYAVGLYFILRARRRSPEDPGRKVLLFAFGLLALNFLSYVPMCAYSGLTGQRGPLFPYLEYSSLIDLLLQILLAFGMVILVMEDIRGELELTNHDLGQATVRLQALAKKDPLTETLNRHAFDSVLRQSEQRSSINKVFNGTVAVLDVDDLKPINDTFGHAAGDAAIRHVAKAVRGVIRADDLLFRWGGDEFVVILLGLSAAEARTRFERIGDSLAKTKLPGAAESVDLHVSFGVASFERPASLEDAISRADTEMYALKQAYKAGRTRKIEVLL